MQIPYVIDNEKCRSSDALSGALGARERQSLDVATAYFTIGGFKLIKEGLEKLGSFRLLLGAEPKSGENIGLRPDAKATHAAMRADLEAAPEGRKAGGSDRRSKAAVNLYGKIFKTRE